jgi:hypothetical protein
LRVSTISDIEHDSNDGKTLTGSYGSDNEGYPINGYYYNAEMKHGASNVFSTAEEIETYLETQELPSDADCHCGGPVLTAEHSFD